RRRSAELYSAVSQICNLQTARTNPTSPPPKRPIPLFKKPFNLPPTCLNLRTGSTTLERTCAWQNKILRYSRLKICAPRLAAPDVQFKPVQPLITTPNPIRGIRAIRGSNPIAVLSLSCPAISKDPLDAKEEHLFVPFLIVQEQFVFIIVAGINHGLADNILQRRTDGSKRLIDPRTPAKRNPRFGIQPKPAAQPAMIPGDRLECLLLPMGAGVIHPAFRKINAQVGRFIRVKRERLKQPRRLVIRFRR